MRIIGGQLRGKKLSPVRAAAVRPTSDRLRETVFNILSGRFEGTVALDLFAGTGALGIEALSRGAAQAVFVDHSREAISMILRNIQLCRLEHRSSVIRWDIARNLDCLRRVNRRYDLVFLDPPYNRGYVLPTLEYLHRNRLLTSDARLIVEHASTEVISPVPASFAITDTREYGKTLVSFLVAVV